MLWVAAICKTQGFETWGLVVKSPASLQVSSLYMHEIEREPYRLSMRIPSRQQALYVSIDVVRTSTSNALHLHET